MKSLLALLATTLLLTFASVDDAQARRLGGGKSFGKSFSTTPLQRKQAPAAPAGQQSRGLGSRGLFGGLMGGLLAGGLLAALFGSGAFEGLQLMDILIFAGLGYLAYRLFAGKSRSRGGQQRASAAGIGRVPLGEPEPPRDAAPDFGGSSNPGIGGPGIGNSGSGQVPQRLPPGFDADAFLNGALDHYRQLQDAWNGNDLAKLREYFSPELFEQLREQRGGMTAQLHTEVLFLDVQIGRADYDDAQAQISLCFSGSCRDQVEGSEEAIGDIWHLERDLRQPDAPWIIVGIES